MTNAEIDALLRRLGKSPGASLSKAAKCFWVSCASATPLAFLTGSGIYFGTFAALAALAAIFCGQMGKEEHRLWQERSALLFWRKWSERALIGERSQGFPATLAMREAVEKIYLKDPRGELLPPRQALRVVDTYNRQLKRLEAVEAHLEDLRKTRESLLEIADHLRELGDGSRDVSAPLARIEVDVPALEALSQELRASCGRLASLLVAVQTSLQVKQLHQELDELTSSVTPKTQILVPESDDLTDIEAQITREIDTFLRLERDTDAHLRQL